jgi:acyl-CoA thioester hydrolase
MRNTAYLECATNSRIAYFHENGFHFDEFQKRGLGPVALKDEVIYFKEIKAFETICISFYVPVLNEDGSRYCMHNTIIKENGVKAAEIISQGAWIDIHRRKLIAPPTDLYSALRLIYYPEIGS